MSTDDIIHGLRLAALQPLQSSEMALLLVKASNEIERLRGEVRGLHSLDLEHFNMHRVQYLAEGTRFKLSFSTKGNTSAFAGYEKALQGKWVALVDATDGKHLPPARCDYEGCVRTVEVEGQLCPRCKEILGE